MTLPQGVWNIALYMVIDARSHSQEEHMKNEFQSWLTEEHEISEETPDLSREQKKMATNFKFIENEPVVEIDGQRGYNLKKAGSCSDNRGGEIAASDYRDLLVHRFEVSHSCQQQL
jgi:(p)ppGpp synthase/HD superfamily hydrolase